MHLLGMLTEILTLHADVKTFKLTKNDIKATRISLTILWSIYFFIYYVVKCFLRKLVSPIKTVCRP